MHKHTITLITALLLLLPAAILAQSKFPQDFAVGTKIFKGLVLSKMDRRMQQKLGMKTNPGISKDITEINDNFSGRHSVYYELYSEPGESENVAGIFVIQFESEKEAVTASKAKSEELLSKHKVMMQKERNIIFIFARHFPSADEVLNRAIFYFTDKGAKVVIPSVQPENIRREMSTDASVEMAMPNVVDSARAMSAEEWEAVEAAEAAATAIMEDADAAKGAQVAGLNADAAVNVKIANAEDLELAVDTIGPETNGHKIKPRRKKSKSDHRLENEAYEAMENKEYDKAISLYKKVLRQEPQNKRAYFNIAWIYANQNKQKEAIAIAQQGLKKVSEDEKNGLYRMIGNAYSDMKDYKQGIKYLQQALVIDGNDANALYNLGYSYFKLHEYDKAIYWLRRAVQEGFGYNDSENLNDVYFYLGTSLGEMGRYEEALPFYDKAIQGSTYFSYYFNKIQALLKLDRKDDALKVANSAVKTNPNNAQVYYKRQQVYRAMGNAVKEKEDIQKAYSLDPNDPDILQDMGVIYERNNEIDKALEVYRAALASGAKKDLVYANIANIYSNDKLMRDSAEIYYKKAIALNPQKAEHYYNYGNFYKKQEQYKKAAAMYQKAIEKNPDLTASYNNLYVVYRKLEDAPKAKEALQDGLAVEPDDLELNSNMVGLLELEQKYSELISYADKALLQKPKGSLKHHLLNARANARLMNGQPQSAIYDYLNLIEDEQKGDTQLSSGVYSNIGYAYLELNKPNDAEKYFKESLQKEKEVDAALGLMLVYHIQGKKSKLEKARAEAIAIKPVLKEGMQGLRKMMEEGYFYTDTQMKMFENLFN